MASDSELVRLAQAGQASGDEELARRWSARVLALCHARVRSAHTAEELAQEALLRGLRALGTLQEPAKFGPWLCGIATRVCLDWLKCGQARQVSLDAMTDGAAAWPAQDEESPVAALERSDDQRRLLAEVATLPEPYREVILMYYYDDVSYHDVALALGVSTATVNARLTKARAMLRERLSGMRR